MTATEMAARDERRGAIAAALGKSRIADGFLGHQEER